ncbi:MAG TPA: hypothetical protein VN837_20540, partial [Chloroflexota bacterium]|nr:hypothetical protein [Chloroflexota bacterium]
MTIMDGRIQVPAEALATPPDFLRRLDDDIQTAGGEVPADPSLADSIGRTMFDLPNSEDGSVTVVLPQDAIKLAPSQALVRVKSRDDR